MVSGDVQRGGGLTVQCRSAVAVVVVQGVTPREREKVHTAVTRYHITVQLLLIAGMACTVSDAVKGFHLSLSL